jgi:serine/threonine-protein kinase
VSVPPAELEVSLSARALEIVRQRPLETVLGFLLLVGVATWIYVGVRNALVGITVNKLQVLLDTEIAALDIWIREKQLNAERWAQDRRVRDDARSLLQRRPAAGASVPGCDGPERDRLLAAVDALLGSETAPGVNLVDRDGLVVASRFAAYCGRLLGPPAQRGLREVLAGQSAFSAPMTEADRVGSVAGDALQRPLVWFSAPVRDDAGAVIGALNIGKYADERFSAVFAAARLGETGEAYAFDLQGRMLSKSRFRAELEDTARLPPGRSEILNLQLLDRDPDRDTNGEREGVLFTRLIESARAGRAKADGALDSGVITEPYRNYLGHPVVGAWRWLAHFDLGVAVEVGEAEAYAPLQRLQRAFLAVLVAAGSALLFLLVAMVRIVRLRRERDEAQRVGNYELIEEVGQGGMARVYRARHRLLKRPTAVKIIELAVANDEMLARFDREVRLASQLMHPNTVEVFDYGRTADGQPFYAMEFLDGLTLQQIVDAHGPLPPERAAHVLRGIAGSLSEAHAMGLVHRDIKPANVMLCRRGGEYDVVKVLDFGLVKDTRSEPTRDHTRALKVLGTPAYMAPERIERAGSADLRSDLYALGAVGFFLLAGRPPFAADNDLALAYQVVHAQAPDLVALVPALRATPAALELAGLIAACLAKDATRRPQQATALIDLLDRLALQIPWTPAAARTWWDAHDAARQAPASLAVA